MWFLDVLVLIAAFVSCSVIWFGKLVIVRLGLGFWHHSRLIQQAVSFRRSQPRIVCHAVPVSVRD